MAQTRYIALDIGSVTVKAAVFDPLGHIIHLTMKRIEGNLHACLMNILHHLNNKYPVDKCFLAAVTGSGAKSLAHNMSFDPINEIMATSTGVLHLSPTSGSILSVGGMGACFIRLMDDPSTGGRVLRDSVRNSRCGAGSGLFIEQEANRFNMSIDQFVNLALQSSCPPIIAGRCTVFAKTDVIHKHQNGVLLKDISAAICLMVARNIAGELIRNTCFDRPVIFIGGVAQNRAVYNMLKKALNLDDGSLLVPPDYLYVNAIGSYLYAASEGQTAKCHLSDALRLIDETYRTNIHQARRLRPLERRAGVEGIGIDNLNRKGGHDLYLLGIDIGSTNTKVVAIDVSGAVMESYSTPTKGQPLEAIREAFERMAITQSGQGPKAVGVTGSGRKYISEVIKADLSINEITAHAEAGIALYPEVDTIIDIGGQDAKFIKIKNGLVTNFEMNKVCSAGTGSFLEESARFLDLNVRHEFAAEVFDAAAPLDLGDRCTVFMTTELAMRQNQGFLVSDIAAGLAYAVINNYISRVVGRLEIGRYVSFQGGVAGNQAVVAALEQILNQKVLVHPHYEIAGAIGAAMIAGRSIKGVSRFSGYTAVERVTPDRESFVCVKCGNNCLINSIRTNDHHRLYTGGVCEGYEEGALSHIYDDTSPLAVRRQLLERFSLEGGNEINDDTIGLPRALHFMELLPFWTTFLKTLGVKFVLSPSTTREMLQSGSEMSPSGSCLPLKIAYGHCLDLYHRGVKRLFIPSLKNLAFNTKTERLNHICPAVQAWPYTAAALLPKEIEIINPAVHMTFPRKFKSDMTTLGRSLGYGRKDILAALSEAEKAQQNMYDAVRVYGDSILNHPDPDKTYAFIFARPYITTDYQVASRLKPILSKLGVVVIPFDMLPAIPMSAGELNGMYWYYGKRYLQAARSMKALKNPVGVFISSYGCGVDSFLIHLLRDALGDIPFLELEIDQHCDFTGLQTRLEAFFYSLRKNQQFNVNPVRRRKDSLASFAGRRIFIPRMSDHALICAATFESFGHKAEVMPMTGDTAMAYGKKTVTGGECLPCTMLAGDMLHTLQSTNGRISPAFFMISGDGPCRLGQYTYLLRKILDEKGYPDIPIIDMSQDTSFYNKLDIVSNAFKKRFWEGSVAVDLLNARYRKLRPCAAQRDYLDGAYNYEINNICHYVNDSNKLRQQLKRSLAALNDFRSADDTPAAKIALVGENYIRCNPAANQNIIDNLEKMKASVYLPPLTEWIYYTNWTARLHCLYEEDYSSYLRLHLINLAQEWQARRLYRPNRERRANLSEPSLKRIFKLASSYVPPSLEGETIISVGRTINYYLQGLDGVIQVAPFGCLAGTIYETFSQRLSDELNGWPILNIQFDGRSDELAREELEGFLILAKNWKKRKGSKQ